MLNMFSESTPYVHDYTIICVYITLSKINVLWALGREILRKAMESIIMIIALIIAAVMKGSISTDVLYSYSF